MSVQIPLNGSAQSATATRGVTIPIGGTLQAPRFFGSSREEKVVRAVAAAAALQDPAAALELAKQAVNDPGAVAGNVIDRPALDPVLQTVAAAVDSPAAAQPTSEQRAAARAVNVDAALVATAQSAVLAGGETAVTEAREWVADIEPVLLERAAQAGLRQRNIDFVPARAAVSVSTSSRLDALEQRVKALEQAQTPAGGAAPKPK
jgi:BMFP domain-containing protein YqiC